MSLTSSRTIQAICFLLIAPVKVLFADLQTNDNQNRDQLVAKSAPLVLYHSDFEFSPALKSLYSSQNIPLTEIKATQGLNGNNSVILYSCEEPAFLINPKYKRVNFLFICDQPKPYLMSKYPVLSTHASPVDQLNLAHVFLPSDKHIATIYSKQSRYLYQYLIEEVQHRQNLTIDGYFHLGQFSIDSSVDKLLTESDFLLAYPDPSVFNQYTMKAILLKLFRLGRPVFGANEEMVDNGSLATLYLKDVDIALTALELINASNRDLTSGIYFSDRYNIKVNKTVAESLSISIPPEKETLETLKRLGKSQPPISSSKPIKERQNEK
jgi:hypothetical protein